MDRRHLMLALCFTFLASAAEAKRVFIDFFGNPTSGNDWTENFEASLSGDASSAAIALGFTINTGAGSFDTIILNENGAVTFGSALPAGFTAVANLGALGVPVIAPYYVNLVSIDGDGSVFFADTGEILYSRGTADPRPDGNGDYDLNEAVPAFHVTWAGPSVGTFAVYTDLVIYDLGGGDFALQFGHGNDTQGGSPGLDIPASVGGLSGFALGGNNLTLSGARSASEDLYYEFRNGVLVPEPAAAALVGAAGLMLAGARRRRTGSR